MRLELAAVVLGETGESGDGCRLPVRLDASSNLELDADEGADDAELEGDLQNNDDEARSAFGSKQKDRSRGKSHLSNRFEVVIQQRRDEALMALDVVKRARQHDRLPDELASERRVEREVERERWQVLRRNLEAEDLSLVGERKNDRVGYRRHIRLGGHDELERRPRLEVAAGVRGAVKLDCGNGRAVEGGRAGKGVTEGELDEAAFVEAGEKAKRISNEAGRSCERRDIHSLVVSVDLKRNDGGWERERRDEVSVSVHRVVEVEVVKSCV